VSPDVSATRSPTALRLAAFVLMLGAFYATFARVALHGFPFSGDEYSTVLQAELFARGKLSSPSPPHAELLRVDHVLMDDGVRSKYPPGASALLALGVRASVPWIVTPLEATLALAAIAFAAWRSLGEREALVATGLLGAAPLFAWQAATFYSHTAATMFLAAAFAAVIEWARREQAWKLVLAGIALGGALLTRPLDAAIFFVALVSLRSLPALVWTGAGIAPFVALLLAYQSAQFGSPFADGYHAYEPTFRAIYGSDTGAHAVALSYLYRPDHLWNHLDILRALVVDWTVPGTALVALLGWLSLRGRRETSVAARLSVALVAVQIASLFVTIGGFDDGARPRYLSTALVPLAWLGAAGWAGAADMLRSRLPIAALRTVGALVWVLPVIQLSAVLVERTPALWVREGLEEAVRREGIRDGVVVIRARWPTRYARNGPFFDRPVLYVSAPPPMPASAVGEAFPGRPLFEATEGERWSLVRVR
jgi:hypothetical protein